MKLKLIAIILSVLSACGGSSSNNTVISGTLTEAGSGHMANLNFKHEAGEKLENIEVCALGKCSTTDAQGQWGFELDQKFSGGMIEFSFKGHGIDQVTSVEVEQSVNDLELDFLHTEAGTIALNHIVADGKVVEHDHVEQHEE